jgi:hypothetical protein
MDIIKFEFINNDTYYTAYFEVTGSKGSTYTLRFEIVDQEVIKDSCDCVFGSMYRFSKDNVDEGKVCRHIKECKNFLKLNGYIT